MLHFKRIVSFLLAAVFIAFSGTVSFAFAETIPAAYVETRDIKLAYLQDLPAGSTGSAYSAARTNASTTAAYDCFNSSRSNGLVGGMAQYKGLGGKFYDYSVNPEDVVYCSPGQDTSSYPKRAYYSSSTTWRVRIFNNDRLGVVFATAAIRD